ncbi:cytosolic protein [Candidatus Woesearchaeota archaeon]|nr:cytosolic protein [Candidatus Woesearchaeota archaeon]
MADCNNKIECPCTYPGCSRKGKCCECLRYHLDNNELPACCFPEDVEKNFDRSFELFCQINNK